MNMAFDKIITTVGLIVLVTVSLRILLFIFRHFSLRRKMSSIPGPKSLPFFGNTLELRKIPIEDLFQWMYNLSLQYEKGIFLIWLGLEPSVHIRKPHQIEMILRSSTLIRKTDLYEFLAYWLGNGLLTSTGDIWRQHRRLITPAFHFAVLDQYTEVFLEKMTIFNSIVQSHLKNEPNKPINIFSMAINYTLDVTCETIMGVDMDIQRKPENEYVKGLHKFAELTIYRFIRLLLRNDSIFYRTSKGREYLKSIHDLHAFTTKVIDEKRKSRQEKKNNARNLLTETDDGIGRHKTKALLDLLMDLSEADENPLTDVELREQVDTFLFGGHDTTGIALSYTLFCLGNYPEIQKRTREEIDNILGDNNHPTRKDLSELKYLDRVIKESLRLFPSAPSISRTLDHDLVIDGYTLPKNVKVSMHFLHLHRDPEFWEDPEKFDPDRFLPENSQGRHPYAYLPFSAGPRNCIGQKFAQVLLKVSLAYILKKWTVVSELKMNELKINAQLVLSPPNKTINLYFKPRMS